MAKTLEGQPQIRLQLRTQTRLEGSNLEQATDLIKPPDKSKHKGRKGLK